MTRVLIVAASAIVRAGLEALVASSPGLSVVGQLASTDALLAETERVAPDVVLVDHKGEDDDFVPTLLALGEGSALPPAAVVLTDNPAALWAAVAARSAVRAVLPREASAEAIAAAVGGRGGGPDRAARVGRGNARVAATLRPSPKRSSRAPVRSRRARSRFWGCSPKGWATRSLPAASASPTIP